MQGVVAGCLLVACIPILCVACIPIAFNNPGPILFRQRRIGQDGRAFKLLKLRTMRTDADLLLKQQLHDDREAAADMAMFGYLRDDPRVCGAAARFMRRHSIDELPQLWHVVTGVMAFVGPRPLPPDQAAYVTLYCPERSSILPGLTGLWQTRGRLSSLRNMARYDKLYMRRRSVRLDLFCIMLTLREIFRPTV
jgi:lipopolysaccharide/colanic/teichoic acid biosynthesis glycosyltransferase